MSLRVLLPPVPSGYKREHYTANRDRYIENARRRKQTRVEERALYLIEDVRTRPCLGGRAGRDREMRRRLRKLPPAADCTARNSHALDLLRFEERATGIEPALRAWKAPVQPQHFAR